MRGQLRKRYDNSWSIILYLGKDELGKKKYKWFTFHGTKPQAEAKLAELIHEYNQSGYVEPSALTVREYLDRWLNEVIKPHRRQKTYEAYEQVVRFHLKPALGHLKLKDIKPMHLQQFFNSLTQKNAHINKSKKEQEQQTEEEPKALSPATVHSYFRTTRAAFNQAVKWGLLKKNPAIGIVLPKIPKSRKQALEGKDIIRLLKVIKEEDRNYAFYILAFFTGMREGEMLGLRWGDIDLEKRVLKVERTLIQGGRNPSFGPPKSDKSEREVWLPQIVVDALKEHKEKQDKHKKTMGAEYKDAIGLVFASKNGYPLSKSNVYKQFQRLLTKAKLPQIAIHEMRHSHVTLLLEMGVPVEFVANRVGHLPAVAREIYFHASRTMQQEVASKLDEAFSEKLFAE